MLKREGSNLGIFETPPRSRKGKGVKEIHPDFFDSDYQGEVASLLT